MSTEPHDENGVKHPAGETIDRRSSASADALAIENLKVERARLRTAALRWAAVLAVAIVVILALWVAIASGGASKDNTARLDDVLAQLDEVRADQVEQTADDLALEECRHRFDVVETRASRDQEAAIAGLVVILARTPPGTPGREALVEAQVIEIDRARTAYDTAVDASTDWQPNPSLPCPIGEQ